MNWEWQKRSRNGKRFFHVGFGTADAVGTEHPASDIPMGEGLRLILAKSIERWWLLVLVGAGIRRLIHKKKK